MDIKISEYVFPRSLMVAAKTFADRPAMLGEILVALVGDGKGALKLSEVQRYIVVQCREEIEEATSFRTRQRAAWAERKRRQRERLAEFAAGAVGRSSTVGAGKRNVREGKGKVHKGKRGSK